MNDDLLKEYVNSAKAQVSQLQLRIDRLETELDNFKDKTQIFRDDIRDRVRTMEVRGAIIYSVLSSGLTLIINVLWQYFSKKS